MNSADQTRLRRVSDDDIDQARRQVGRAFGLLGLVENGNPSCPECGTAKKGKVALRSDKGYWKCFRCDAWGSPIKLLEANGYSFVDAVNALLGRQVSSQAAARIPAKVAEPKASTGFRQHLDVEVYRSIIQAGDSDAAARYYGRWHIAADAVARAGAVRIMRTKDLQRDLLAAYGRTRLVRAGVIKPAEETDKGEDAWLVNRQYPVIEPHTMPDGTVVGMQMRPDEQQLAKVEAHKQGRGPYVPKFLSLRGAGPDGLVGCGLNLLTEAEGEAVYIVEGFKDLLAVMTMGARAYAIPGAAAQIPDVAVKILARNRPIVALDADDAGAAGSDRVAQTLRDIGISSVAVKRDMPAGMDPTDVLVARHARAGCTCAACETMRARLSQS